MPTSDSTTISDVSVSESEDLLVEEGGIVTLQSRGTITAAGVASTEIFTRYGAWREDGKRFLIDFEDRDVVGGFALAFELDCEIKRRELVCDAGEGEPEYVWSVADDPPPSEGWSLVELIFNGETTPYPVVKFVEEEGRPYTSSLTAGLDLSGNGAAAMTWADSLTGDHDAYSLVGTATGVWTDEGNAFEVRFEDRFFDLSCAPAGDLLRCASLSHDETTVWAPLDGSEGR